MTRTLPRRTLVGAVALLAVVVASAGTSPAATLAAVESVASDPYRFGLLVAGLYLVRPLFAWPTTPLSLVVGYGFGVTVGVPVALVGVVCTAIPVYVVVRWFAADASPEELATLPFGSVLDRANRAVAGYYETAGPLRGVTASRLAPIPADVATCAAAISGVSLRHLVIGTAVGEIPWTVAAVVVGSSAATVTTDGVGGLGVPLAIGCTIAATVLLAGPAYRSARIYVQNVSEQS